jgi:hypothetical protein
MLPIHSPVKRSEKHTRAKKTRQSRGNKKREERENSREDQEPLAISQVQAIPAKPSGPISWNQP